MGGSARVWVSGALDARRQEWYDERLIPSLRPLLELDAEALLMTHGPPIMSGCREALADALQSPPFGHAP